MGTWLQIMDIRKHMTKPLVKMIGAFGLVLGGCGSAHQAVPLGERCPPECGREGLHRVDMSKEVGHAG